MNVVEKLKQRGYGARKAKVTASDLTGVCLRTVQTICREAQTKGDKPLQSNSRIVCNRKDAFDKLLDYQKLDIENAVHQEFRLVAVERERPYISIRGLHCKLMQDPEFPRMSKESLRKILHSMGFRFMSTQTDRNVLLIDSPDLIDKRKKWVFCSKQVLLEYLVHSCWIFLDISKAIRILWHFQMIRIFRKPRIFQLGLQLIMLTFYLGEKHFNQVCHFDFEFRLHHHNRI